MNSDVHKKKILFVLPEFFPETGGGICSYYTSLLAKLKNSANWDITVVQGSLYSMPGGENLWSGLSVHHLSKSLFDNRRNDFKHFNIMPEFQNHISSAWALYDLAQSLEIKFDVVITTDWGLGFIPWVINNNIPTIIHLHGSIGQIDYYDPRIGMEFWSNLYLNAEINLFNYANALATYSIQNINFWTKKLINKEKFSLIMPVIENDYALVQNERTNLVTGLVIGRIQYWKGVIRLCEAIDLLEEKEKTRLKIYWIGRDTYYHDAGKNMHEYLSEKFPHIWKKIILPIGSKTHEQIEEFYKCVNFTMVPSTWDMFNITAIEHLLHKKPLICSTGAGASDFLQDPEAVLIFNNTSIDLANQLKGVMNKSEHELDRIAQNGFDLAKKIFNTENTVNKHIDLINNTIVTFQKQEGLKNVFAWLMPNEINHLNTSKEVMLQTWSLKTVVKITFKMIKKKAASYLNHFSKDKSDYTK